VKNWNEKHNAVLHMQRKQKQNKLEYGSISNVMAALPNIGGAVCSKPQSLANAHYQSAAQ